MLYHKQLGIPRNTQTDFGCLKLIYTRHAKYRIKEINIIIPPKVIYTGFHDTKVIEVETDDDGNTRKVVYRIPYDQKYDLVLAVLVPKGVVKTIWLNGVNDIHKTLNSGKYDIPQNDSDEAV